MARIELLFRDDFRNDKADNDPMICRFFLYVWV